MLDDLASQTRLPESVIVVDNGGTLRERDLREMPLSGVTSLVSRVDNPGYATAVNLTKDLLGPKSEALLVLTHDTEFDDDLAAGLLAALEADSSAGAAGPLLHWSSQPGRVFSAGGVLKSGGRATHLTSARQNSPYQVDWVDGAVVMYRRSSLEAIDWMDERYFLYFEDVDTAWAMKKRGHRTLVVPGVTARQEPGEHPLYLGIRNMTLFGRKSAEPSSLQVIAVARRVAEDALWRTLHGRPPRIRAAWRGWSDGKRGISGKPRDTQ